jgi:hypothetical protein
MKKIIIGVFGVIFFVGLLSIYSVAVGADKTADVLVWLKLNGGLLPEPFEATVSLSNKNSFSIYNKTIKVKNDPTVGFKDVPYGKYILSVKDGKAKGQKLGDGSSIVEIAKPYVTLTLNWKATYGILEVSQESGKAEAKEAGAMKAFQKHTQEPKPAEKW